MLARSLIDSSHQSMLTSPHLTSPHLSGLPPLCHPTLSARLRRGIVTVVRLYSALRSLLEVQWKYSSVAIDLCISIYLSLISRREGKIEGKNEVWKERTIKASRDLDLPHSALLVSTQSLTSPRTSSGEWPGSTTIIYVTCKRGRLTTFVDANIAVFSVT